MDMNDLEGINMEMEKMFKENMLIERVDKKEVDTEKMNMIKKKKIIIDNKFIDKVIINTCVYENVVPCNYLNKITRVFDDMKQIKIEMKKDRVINCTMDYLLKLRLSTMVKVAKGLMSRKEVVIDVVNKRKLEDKIKDDSITDILVYFYKPCVIKRGKNKKTVDGNTFIFFYNIEKYFCNNMSFSERQYIIFY